MYSTQIAILILLNYNWNLFLSWECRKWIKQIIFLIAKKWQGLFLNAIKSFCRFKTILDRTTHFEWFQNVKFSSRNLVLDWSRTFSIHPKQLSASLDEIAAKEFMVWSIPGQNQWRCQGTLQRIEYQIIQCTFLYFRWLQLYDRLASTGICQPGRDSR